MISQAKSSAAAVAFSLMCYVTPAAAESGLSVAVSAGPTSGVSSLEAKHFEVALRSTRRLWFFEASLADYRESERSLHVGVANYDSYSFVATIGLVKRIGRYQVSAGMGPTVWFKSDSRVEGVGVRGMANVEARVAGRLSLFLGGHLQRAALPDFGEDIRALVVGVRLVLR